MTRPSPHGLHGIHTLEFLKRAQNPDGGWGYGLHRRSMTEPTSAVLLAMAELLERPAVAAGRAWLQRAQHRDGGWGLDPEDPDSSWPTAWAVLTLARWDPAAPEVIRGVRWLLQAPAIRLQTDELTAEVYRSLRIDPSLRGWPWRPGEASWVEPTALTLLALHAASATAEHGERIAEAIRYLSDRRCQGGGWNFGNPFMLGAYLPPRPHPTAWALLALHILAPPAIRPEDIEALRVEMHRDGGAMALALGIMALEAIGVEDREARERLTAMQRPDGSWEENPYTTALAWMALHGGWPWRRRD